MHGIIRKRSHNLVVVVDDEHRPIGIVTDANALRASEGLPVLGSKLNTQLYQLAKVDYSTIYDDITTGNNLVHAASVGFDLAFLSSV